MKKLDSDEQEEIDSKGRRSRSGYGDRGINPLLEEIDAYEEGHAENPRETYTHTSTSYSPSFKSFLLPISDWRLLCINFVEWVIFTSKMDSELRVCRILPTPPIPYIPLVLNPSLMGNYGSPKLRKLSALCFLPSLSFRWIVFGCFGIAKWIVNL
ncbi:hypothetical protein F2Q69_00046279 [Brassica cretica]|uniref:Uncharacterized protein n=1 Tax=Brassica cretica TaxID=69181 RepID=A0A8S9PKZ3_BRACR|nr:hypothetical protein F2Q69_00046279 [Brassica cretica]